MQCKRQLRAKKKWLGVYLGYRSTWQDRDPAQVDTAQNPSYVVKNFGIVD